MGWVRGRKAGGEGLRDQWGKVSVRTWRPQQVLVTELGNETVED